MKQFFALSIVLLLLSTYDAAEFISPSESPVSSPSSEPSSNNDCSTVVYGMLDCLSFLTVGSTDLSPTKTCCDGVETVLEYNSTCLCVALESSSAMGFDLINSRALALPSTCNIPIDPHCEDALSPVPSPPIASPVSPSKPPTTSPPCSSPARTTPPPYVTPSPPANSHSSPAKPASPPTTAHSTPTITAPSPAMTAPSPSNSGTKTPTITAQSPAMVAPSPSNSGTKNVSVSKIFLTIMIISSFVYVLA